MMKEKKNKKLHRYEGYPNLKFYSKFYRRIKPVTRKELDETLKSKMRWADDSFEELMTIKEMYEKFRGDRKVIQTIVRLEQKRNAEFEDVLEWMDILEACIKELELYEQQHILVH